MGSLSLLQKQESVHRSILQAATAVNMEPELVQTLLDKSIPTFVGLAGEHGNGRVMPASFALTCLHSRS